MTSKTIILYLNNMKKSDAILLKKGYKDIMESVLIISSCNTPSEITGEELKKMYSEAEENSKLMDSIINDRANGINP